MSLTTADSLLTDLYQFTMLQSYRAEHMNDTAVFEFFVRRLPEQRNFLVAAGLEQLLSYLENWQFTGAELDWLVSSGHCTPDFADYLATLRFTGDVDALPEGTVFFADEPVVRVTAPLAQAQFIESRLVNILHFQTLIASKAARCSLSASGKRLIDFGMRRAHGAEAALFAARASYLAGFDGTATVLAEREYGIPAFGTMAHSYIQAHASESDAFKQFALSHPDNSTLLIDTYDTERGAQRVLDLLPQLRTQNATVRAVRLDSGDFAVLSRKVRKLFDSADQRALQIFVSGSLDEYVIAQLLADNAPIDGFGVGTALVVSSDAPALDCAYKLQEYAGVARRKRSARKATWPGRKQIYRHYRADGKMDYDVLALFDECDQSGEPLLTPAMRGGRRVEKSLPLAEVRVYCAQQLSQLTERLRDLHSSTRYTVRISPALRELADAVDREFS